MKRLSIIAFFALFANTIFAQQENQQWIKDIKLSGYGIIQYNATTQKAAKANGFNLRLGRLILDGKIQNNIVWRVQMQINGNTSSLGASPRLVDLYAEWQRYSFAKVKVGQFKRPFTFENPLHPIEQGFMSYSQSVLQLAGFTDRTKEHPSNGRDIGVQLQGDFLPTISGRKLIHYQIGIFNGEGINTKDANQQKDIIGGFWLNPIKELRIGAFGWVGSTTRQATYTQEINTPSNPYTHTIKETVTLQKRRYAISAEYKKNDWTIRSEYIHSTGESFKNNNPNGKSQESVAISNLGNKAEGGYFLTIAPLIKNKLYAKARYDVYTPTNSWSKKKTLYEVGLNYEFSKRLKLTGEYAFVNDKSLTNPNYNIIDIQLSFRF